jgi:DNA segregation ATPase FtsK/SpoIIIE-like protein
MAVRDEEQLQEMSKLGVRNIDGYNRAAEAKGRARSCPAPSTPATTRKAAKPSTNEEHDLGAAPSS